MYYKKPRKMKKILFLAGLALSLGSSINSEAQVRVSLNIGRPVTQQPWYANDNDYYYLPEQGVYYNTRRRVYVYPENGAWLTASRLPARYGNYGYTRSKYVRVRDRSPFDRDNDYRTKYGRRDNDNHHDRDRDRRDGRDRHNDHDRDRDRDRDDNHRGH
jgi:hypothetical protein